MKYGEGLNSTPLPLPVPKNRTVPISCPSVSGIIFILANTNNIMQRRQRGESQCVQIGQAKVWTFMVQDVGMCSEGSQFQCNHKARFVLKVETERGKEGKKKGWVEGNQAFMCWSYHNYDPESLSQEVFTLKLLFLTTKIMC